MKRSKKMTSRKSARFLARILLSLMLISVPLSMAPEFSFAASSASPIATGKVNSKEGAFVRKKATKKSDIVTGLDNNTDLVIMKEVFVTFRKTSSTKKWYYVKAGSKKGYIRSDLVKNIKYSSVNAYAKNKTNYRAGAGIFMSRKGTVQKGANITILLKAKAYGSSQDWYKIRRGSKIYYVAANNITTKKTSTPVESSGPVTFTLKNVTYPETIGKGTPFVLKGTINSSKEISMVKGGIVNSKGKWIMSVTEEVNANTFNIATIDLQIKFGTLNYGSYVYRVNAYIGDKCYTQIKQKFRIVKPVKAKKIANKALKVCWPADTPAKKYKYGKKTGKATDEYKEALDIAYPDRKKWGKAPRRGASCDVFVGTVLRASGVDPDAPRGLDEQLPYYKKSGKYTRISYNGDHDLLQTGDIVIFKRKAGNTHTCIFIRKNGVEYIAEANYRHTYAYLTDDPSDVNSKLTKKDKKYIYIYRINEG